MDAVSWGLAREQMPLPNSHVNQGLIVDLLPQAVLLVQDDGRVMASNPTARRWIGDGCIRLVEGRLATVGQLGLQQLNQLLRQAATGSKLNCAVWFSQTLCTGLLHLSRPPLTLDAPAAQQLGTVLLVVQTDQPALMQSARIDALTQKCRLSPAERHVLMLLADGMRAEEVARHLSLQLSTVRSHVRNLLGKTQAPNLMQLLRWTGSAAALPH